jgi:DNA-3-methyladenine glycosylase II
MVITDEIAKQAAVHLSAHDPVMAKLVERFGVCPLRPHRNFYQELVESIIGQQLSLSAARAITVRFLGLFDGEFPEPQQILDVPADELRHIGFSYRKAAYVQDLAQHVVDGRVRFDHLPALSNQAIIAELTSVKGIGEWTVHMFLLFCMGRSTVLPVGDLGIRNAIQVKYNIGHKPIPSEIEAIATAGNWHPYESIASWYLWKSLGNNPPSDVIP